MTTSSGFGELVLLLGDLNLPYRTSASHIPEKFQRMLVPNKLQHVFCTGNLGADPKRILNEVLKPLAPNVHVVSGDYDPVFSNSSSSSSDDCNNDTVHFPDSKVLQIGPFRIGLIHGHQVVPWGDPASLSMIRRKLDVDILVYGNAHANAYDIHNYETSAFTSSSARQDGEDNDDRSSNHHRRRGYDVCEYEGFYHIYPGSMTGTGIAGTSSPPSFILLSIQGNKVVAYCYELKKGLKEGEEDQVDVSKSEFTKSDLRSRRT